MPLDNLPPEILDLIAGYILLAEASSKVYPKGICLYTHDGDDRHQAASYTTSGPFPAKSSVTSLASVSHHLRDVLFTSRKSRFVKVKFDGRDFRKAVGIHPGLISVVSKLRLITTPQPFETPSDESSPAGYNKYQGIGEVLLPYPLLQHLEIEWCLLERDDPRIKAMEKSANAIPVMKFDLRCSRSCTLWTVQDLHIKLASFGSTIDRPGEARLAQQLDLITQQFDLPCLRNLHISHDFDGEMDSFTAQWTILLPTIRLQYWPRLESVQICVAMSYSLFSGEGMEREVAEPRWRPFVQSILDHLATAKNPLKANITILWKFTPNISPFADTGDDQGTLREQIMPTHDTFLDLVQHLQGRAATLPFTLEIRGVTGSNNIDSKRLLQASYDPEVPHQSERTGPSLDRAPKDALGKIQFELDRPAIAQLRCATAAAPMLHQLLAGRLGRVHQARHHHHQLIAPFDHLEEETDSEEEDWLEHEREIDRPRSPRPGAAQHLQFLRTWGMNPRRVPIVGGPMEIDEEAAAATVE